MSAQSAFDANQFPRLCETLFEFREREFGPSIRLVGDVGTYGQDFTLSDAVVGRDPLVCFVGVCYSWWSAGLLPSGVE